MVMKNGDLRLFDAFNFKAPGMTTTPGQHDPVFDEHIIREDLLLTGWSAMAVGFVPDPENFSRDTMTEGYIDIHALPIKQAGSDEYRIPREVHALYGRSIQAIFADQYARSPAARDKRALLYAHRSYVHSGAFQRTPNWHRDNVASINPGSDPFIPVSTKIPLHVYVVSDFAETEVQARPVQNAPEFFQHGNPSDAATEAGHTRQLERYQIGLFNDYVWHRGGRAREAGSIRNFLSVAFIPTQSMEQAIARGAYRRAPDYGHLQF